MLTRAQLPYLNYSAFTAGYRKLSFLNCVSFLLWLRSWRYCTFRKSEIKYLYYGIYYGNFPSCRRRY